MDPKADPKQDQELCRIEDPEVPTYVHTMYTKILLYVSMHIDCAQPSWPQVLTYFEIAIREARARSRNPGSRRSRRLPLFPNTSPSLAS